MDMFSVTLILQTLVFCVKMSELPLANMISSLPVNVQVLFMGYLACIGVCVCLPLNTKFP